MAPPPRSTLPRMEGAARIESVSAAAHAESAEMPRARPGESSWSSRTRTRCALRPSPCSKISAIQCSSRAKGGEGLARFRDGERVDILVTDVVLPQGMTGGRSRSRPPPCDLICPGGLTRGAVSRQAIHARRLAHKVRAVIDSSVKA
jgi:hypothetical protein